MASMAPSLGAPVALASYPSGSNLATSTGTLSIGSAWRQSKSASLRKDGDVLVVSHVQRGIEISQLSTTPPTPLASLTLPVGSSATSNAVSITRTAPSSSSSSTGRSRTTYFALRTAQSSFEVRAWSEGLIGRDGRAKGAEGQQPATCIFESPRAVVSLHALSPDLLLAIDDDAILILLERADASTESAWSSKGEGCKVDGMLHKAVASRELAVDDSKTAIVALSSAAKASNAAASSRKKAGSGRKSAIESISAVEAPSARNPTGPLFCSVFAAGGEGIERLALIQVPKEIVADAGDVVASDVDENGSILILTREGKLHELTPVLSGTPYLRTAGSLFLPRLANLPAALLHSSPDYAHVVSVAKKDPESASSPTIAHVLALDVRIGSVVSTHSFKLPSSLGLQMSEQNGGPFTALQLSIADIDSRQTSSRLVISATGAQAAATFVAEHTTPETSSLSFAVSDVTTKLSRAWIGEGSLHASREESALVHLSEGERQIIAKLSDIRSKQGATTAAFGQIDEAFAAWTEAELQRLRKEQELERAAEAKAKAKAKADSDNSDADEGDDAADKAAAAAQSQRTWSKPVRLHLSTAFCEALLPLLFDSPGAVAKATLLHASKSVYYLLDRRLLSETIWDQACERQQQQQPESRSGHQSLLLRLAAAGDWSTAMHAMRYLPDVRERDAVALLELVSRPKQTSGVSLPMLLSVLVGMECSRTTLRRALKDGLGNVEAVMRILNVLERWLRERAMEGEALGISGDGGPPAKPGAPANQVGNVTSARRKRFVGKAQDGEKAKKPEAKEEQSDLRVKVPRLDHILSMISDLLDVYYPVLLSTPSSHGIVRRLSGSMSVHLGHLVDLRALVGPLASYARLDADRKAERASGGGAAVHTTNDAGAAQAITGGGRSTAPQKNRRVLELEESAMAGPYVVEELEL